MSDNIKWWLPEHRAEWRELCTAVDDSEGLEEADYIEGVERERDAALRRVAYLEAAMKAAIDAPYYGSMPLIIRAALSGTWVQDQDQEARND